MICGVLGSLPMTGVIVRSSANVQAGAQHALRPSCTAYGCSLLYPLSHSCCGTFPWLRWRRSSCTRALKLVDRKSFAQIRQYGRMPVAHLSGDSGRNRRGGPIDGRIDRNRLSIVKLLYKVTHFHADFRLDPVRRRGELHIEGLATFSPCRGSRRSWTAFPRAPKCTCRRRDWFISITPASTCSAVGPSRTPAPDRHWSSNGMD